MLHNDYLRRHIGPGKDEIKKMISHTGNENIEELLDRTVPSHIKLKQEPNLPESISEYELLQYIREISFKNKIHRSYIGMGYYNTITPSVILRNIFENPSWYTSYTPYQAEISQGRLEALLNFQTMVMDLTAMDIANASLLDDATAAAEAMIMMYNSRSRDAVKRNVSKLFIDRNTFPHIIDVVTTRARNLNIEVITGDYSTFTFGDDFFGVIVQYPGDDGRIIDFSAFFERCHQDGILTTCVADIMGLVLLSPPGKAGADIVVGSTQRFGVPLGYGGPHAAFFATREKFKRMIPGRIIGVTIDANDKRAYRMALQTREQHIKRERATSNICTAQALLAIMSGMFAVYHGPEGLKKIATNIHLSASLLNETIRKLGYQVEIDDFFDTLKVNLPQGITKKDIEILAGEAEINLRYFDDHTIGVSLDETVTVNDLNDLIGIFARAAGKKFDQVKDIRGDVQIKNDFLRKDSILDIAVFRDYHSETEMMRYIKRLEKKDISLTHSMISLGSCTMKLNAATTLIPLSWPEYNSIHPFVPVSQTEGYQQLFYELGKYLKAITGFDGISFQPNSGASGEYTGLIVIKEYHKSKGDEKRDVVLIPTSAHGTNPASAVMAGLRVVLVKCDEKGNIDINDLKSKAKEHGEHLSSVMITYPSTHGVYESKINEITDIVHHYGGQVYMDGANMNAQVGLTNPATIGADVCHLNLHKTFAIPHGGGGPGVGPICVAGHLTKFLPTHSVVQTGGTSGVGAVSASPWGSASILTISYAYIRMLGKEGMKRVSEVAILNSNYLASALKDHYHILYTGENNTVAHEMIIDCREFKPLANITEIDIAKRLIDYGFHAPTVSFPVHGTLMIEPTESESLNELDRFVEAMISIHGEIMEIAEGQADKVDNVLKNAPHSYHTITKDDWKHAYPRSKAAYPLTWIKENKFWPPVDRINDAWGDRHLICSCAPLQEYAG